jgi:hypothetical protein
MQPHYHPAPRPTVWRWLFRYCFVPLLGGGAVGLALLVFAGADSPAHPPLLRPAEIVRWNDDGTALACCRRCRGAGKDARGKPCADCGGTGRRLVSDPAELPPRPR